MKFPEFWVEWVWRFFPRRAVFCRAAKREKQKVGGELLAYVW